MSKNGGLTLVAQQPGDLKGIKSFQSHEPLSNKIEKLRGLMRTMETATTEIKKAPEYTCSVTTAAQGVSYLMAGGIFSSFFGLLLTGSGLKLLWDTLKLGTKAEATIDVLIKDAKVNLENIEETCDENNQGFTRVEGHLKKIKNQSNELERKHKQLKEIITSGKKELSTKKKEVDELFKKTKEQFALAEKLMHQAASNQRDARANCVYAQGHARDAYEALQNKNKCLSERLGNAQESITKLRSELDKTNENQTESLNLLTQAMVVNNQALVLFNDFKGAFDDLTKKALDAFVEADNIDYEHTIINESFDKIDMEFVDLEWNNRYIQYQSGLAKENVQSIEDINQSWQGVLLDSIKAATIWAGAGSTACLTNMMLGGMGGALLTNYAIKQRKPIFDRTTDVILPMENKELKPIFESKDGNISFAFNYKSSGYMGRMLKDQSHTHGVLTLKIGDTTLKGAIDLDAKNPIQQGFLRDIQHQMIKALRENQISREACLSMIATLQTCVIDRGKNHKSTQGLINPADDMCFGKVLRFMVLLEEIRHAHAA